MTKKNPVGKVFGGSNLGASIITSILGLFVGFLVLFVTDPGNSIKGFIALLTGPVSSGLSGFGNVISYASIFILCGLSVGFAGKTGVFNIGGSGQFLIAGVTSIYVAILWPWLPPVLHGLISILAGIIAGAIWCSLIGLLKAFFNVNEVVAGILLNYVSLYLSNMIVLDHLYDSLANRSKAVPASLLVPTLGLDKIFPGTGADISIVVAIITALIIYIILDKTNFGYELRTCGYNKNAGLYCGINVKKNIILSMLIAGALSGLAGAMFYLSSSYNYVSVVDALPSQPMQGIVSSLIAMGNPLGIIFSSFFVAYISVSGLNMQLYGYAPEIVSVVTSAIIYCCAFVILFKKYIGILSSKFTTLFNTLKEGKV